MFWNAKSGSVHIDNTEMDYITFGMGKENLVMIPGLGDGLTTVKGMAAILAFTYKSYAKDYKVYIQYIQFKIFLVSFLRHLSIIYCD